MAGGKGGVGKTVLTAAMGLALAENGIKSVLVDADLGGANLHQTLGIPSPPVTLRDFFSERIPQLGDLCLETLRPELRFISGAPHALGLANIKYSLKYRLIRQLRQLQGDFVLLDIGAGSAFNELDFFIQADVGVVVITPEPLAIQNGYNFIKLCLLRLLTRYFRNHAEVSQILKSHLNPHDLSSTPAIHVLDDQVRELGTEVYDRWKKVIAAFQPRLVLNMLETQQDYNEGMAAVIAANDILGLAVHHLHHIHYDESLRHAIKEGQPQQILGREDGAAFDVRQIVQQLFFNKRLSTPTFRRNGKATGAVTADAGDNGLICSVRCSIWGRCSRQRGGYPCRIRVIGAVNQKQEQSQKTA